MYLSNTASLYRNAAPDDFSPYDSIFTSINVPSSFPISGPTNVQRFSLQGAVRYAFFISQANLSILFNAAIVKAILIDSLETTNINVIEYGNAGVCPPPTSCNFLLNSRLV